MRRIMPFIMQVQNHNSVAENNSLAESNVLSRSRNGKWPGSNTQFLGTVLFQLSVQRSFPDAQQAGRQQLITVQLRNRIEDGLLLQLRHRHNLRTISTGGGPTCL